MSVVRIPTQKPLTLRESERAGMHVFIYCLACGHSRRDDPYVVSRQLCHDARFGMLLGRYRCRCGASMAVILPWYAPTPIAWATSAEGRHALEPEMAAEIKPAESDFTFRIDRWRGSGVDKTLALVDDLTVAGKTFEAAAEAFAPQLVTLRNRAKVVRSSALTPVE